MTTTKRILTACLFMFAVSGCAPPGVPKLIIIGITGEVTSVTDWDGFLGGAVQEGDIITGTYTYDTSTPDSLGEPAEGQYLYQSPPFGISMKIGRLEFKTDPDNVAFVIAITDDFTRADSGPPMDCMYIYSHNNLLAPIGTPRGYHIQLFLKSDDGTAISGDALPSTAPVLSDWSGARVTIACTGAPCQAREFAITGYWTDAFVTRSLRRQD